MLYNYSEIISIYKNDYELNKAVEKEEIFKIEKGIYSNVKNVKKLDVFVKKHKNPIFTMESAFYYYGISDVIPKNYSIALSKNGTRFVDEEIKTYFMDTALLNSGVCNIDYLGTNIKIYSKERLLIEIIRYKNSISYDYYKEIINYYRKNVDKLNIQELEEMIYKFPKKDMIYRILQDEVL